MRQPYVDWEELGMEAARDRRRETRVALQFSIEVSGFDLRGRFFSEKTKTTNISESGCHFLLTNGVKPGGVVAVKVVCGPENEMYGRRLLYQVVHAKEVREGWSVGAAKLQAESLWCVAFPASSRNGRARAGIPEAAQRDSNETHGSEITAGDSASS